MIILKALLRAPRVPTALASVASVRGESFDVLTQKKSYLYYYLSITYLNQNGIKIIVVETTLDSKNSALTFRPSKTNRCSVGIS
jgi:hypothetical protein